MPRGVKIEFKAIWRVFCGLVRQRYVKNKTGAFQTQCVCFKRGLTWVGGMKLQYFMNLVKLSTKVLN